MCDVKLNAQTVLQASLTEGDERHRKDLYARAEHDSKQHAIPGRTEHVSVNQFPAVLFLTVLTSVDLRRYKRCKNCQWRYK